MARSPLSLLLLAALAAALCAMAAAQPCIECKDCRGSDVCLSRCSRSCPKRVDLDVCKSRGRSAGRRVGSSSCDLAKTYCRGGQRTMALAAREISVPVKQCAAAAYGICQNVAMMDSSCSRYFRSGLDQCTGSQFRSFYTDLVNEGCNKEADKIEQELGGGGSGGGR